MSKTRKAKKMRQPNIPAALADPTPSAAVSTPTVAKTGEPAAVFNYAHTKEDLKRIGILAASFIAILVVLSFFIR
jgi:hypothetical protein